MTQAPVRTKLELTLLPGDGRVDEIHRGAGAQLDDLCGPFWISILLRARGFDVTQEDAAVEAGTVLAATAAPGASVPPGEPDRRATDPRIARTDDRAATGTSIAGMLAAADGLSSGAWRFVPVAGRHGRALGPGALELLLELTADRIAWGASILLNLRTGALWGTRLPTVDGLAYLAGADVRSPAAEWDVGHFVDVGGLLRAEDRSMLSLRDSYPSFGLGGQHLQPITAVAAAVGRGDGREGGALVLVRSDQVPAVEAALRGEGFDIRSWDNGSPDGGGAR